MSKIFFPPRPEPRPGSFPAEMDKTKLGKLSVRRNELIADIFARMDKVERVGSGFRRIKEALDDANLPFPRRQGFQIIPGFAVGHRPKRVG